MCWASTNGILLTLQVWSLERRDIKFHQELQGLNHWVRALVAHNNFLYSGSYQTIKVLLFVISWPNVWAERIHIQGRRSSGRQGGGSKTVEGNFLVKQLRAISVEGKGRNSCNKFVSSWSWSTMKSPMILLWKADVLEMGVQRLQAHRQPFGFADILDKSPENPGKNGAQRCLTSNNGAEGLHKNTWRPFIGGYTKTRSSWSLWEKILGKRCTKNFLSKFGEVGQNLSHPKNLPSTPMMTRYLRGRCPSFERAEEKCPCHASNLPRPCTYYFTRTPFTRCCRLQCVTAMNMNCQRSPKTEQFVIAKVSGNALKQGSRTHSVLRQRSS